MSPAPWSSPTRVFTATAVILQPVTGALLAHELGWPLTEGWIVLSLALYVVTGLFWLPVVFIQIRLRDLARQAPPAKALPPAYFRLYRIWFACGFPAFFAVLAIFWLMLARPSIDAVQLSIGQIVAASSTPIAMLNHFSRVGSARKPRMATPNPAQTETLGRFTSVKATTTIATDRNAFADWCRRPSRRPPSPRPSD